MSRRSVAFVTTSRADFGIGRWIVEDLNTFPDVTAGVIAMGSHLLDSEDGTLREVRATGLPILAIVGAPLDSDSAVDIGRWLGDLLAQMTRVLVEVRPSMVMIVGDRIEALVAVQAAMLVRLPVAHLHGGEVTAGAIDEGIRHAITKMSHLHFTADEAYARRVVQMGEDPAHVYVVGAPGLSAIAREPMPTEAEIRERMLVAASRDYVMVTYHPVTAIEAGEQEEELEALVEALTAMDDLDVILTGVNADPGSARVREALVGLVAEHSDRCRLISSLGHAGYLAALRYAVACVGNSSSGIIEAPALGTPTVNIGRRQEGRIRHPLVADTLGNTVAIVAAVDRARALRNAGTKDALTPDALDASYRVARILSEVEITGLLVKSFHDLSVDPLVGDIGHE